MSRALVDSFVMQTNVQHPSDIRQVADGSRVALRQGTPRLRALPRATVLASNRVTLGRLCWALDDADVLPAQTRRNAS